MRGALVLLILINVLPAWSCLQPSSEELSVFFEDSAFWTEVEDSKSFELAKRRPVFLFIAFNANEGTRIRWGDNSISGSDLSLCWKNYKKDQIVIRRGFFKTTLVKVAPGLLKSWIPLDGDLFYRKDAEVKRPTQGRDLADEAP